MSVDISVVVPAYNEDQNIRPLFERIQKTLLETGREFEVVFVNDASSDSSEQVLEEIYNSNESVVVINLFKRSGKAIALERGFEFVTGEYVVTIDADLQHDPEDIPKLLEEMDKGFDVVSGQRTDRHDSKGKILTSRIFNVLMRMIAGLKIDDYFSGLKCFRAKVIHFLALYGDLYRFAAVFAHREGFKVKEIPTAHHQRAHGSSKYSPIMRLKRAVQDLITVMFSITLSRRRAYYIGVLSLLLISIGITLLMVSTFLYGFDIVVFKSISGLLGACFMFLGLQLVIVRKIADSFFTWHYEEFCNRQRNVRSVLK